MSGEEGKGPGWRTTWAPTRPQPAPGLCPLGSPSAQLGGLRGRRREEGRGFLPTAPIPVSLGRSSVWLLLKAGNKGPN